MQIVAVWLAGSAIAVAVVLHLPTLYSSEALILVDSQKIPEKYVTSTVNTDVQDRLATIRQQILSSTRLKKIIDDFDLYRKERKNHVEEEILEMIRKDISIKVERGWSGNRPGAFWVGYQGPDPTVVAQVANRIANFYIEENLKTREVQAEGTSEFIDHQLQEAKKRLDELEATVSAYKVKHNGELPQQESVLTNVLSRLQLDLQANREAIKRAQETKLVLENTLNLAESTVSAVSRVLENRSTAAGAPLSVDAGGRPQKRSEILEAQLAAMRIRYSDDHPDVKRLRYDLARVKSQEEQEERASAAAKPANPPAAEAAKPAPRPAKLVLNPREALELSQARERVTTMKSQIAVNDRELEARQTEQQRILRDIASYQGRLDRLPVREQEMAGITRDYDIAKANYKSLLDKKLSAEMATDMERRQKSERFMILDPARVPEKPFKPNRPVLAGMGSCVGLALSLLVAFARELRRNVVLGEWELPSNTVILGRLPLIQLHTETPAGGARRRLKRGIRLAIFSSALVSLLGIIVIGLYWVTHRL